MDAVTVLLMEPVFAIFVDAVDFATLRNLRLVCKPLLGAVRARCDPTHWLAARHFLVNRFADVETLEEETKLAVALLDTVARQLPPHSVLLPILGVCDPRFDAADLARFREWLDTQGAAAWTGRRLGRESANDVMLLVRAKRLDCRWDAPHNRLTIFYPAIATSWDAPWSCGKNLFVTFSLRGRNERGNVNGSTGFLFQVQLLTNRTPRAPSDPITVTTYGFKYWSYGPTTAARFRVQMPLFGF